MNANISRLAMHMVKSEKIRYRELKSSSVQHQPVTNKKRAMTIIGLRNDRRADAAHGSAGGNIRGQTSVGQP